MRLEFNEHNLGTGVRGLEIGIEGFCDSPTTDPLFPSQIYVELYEGKLLVHVWDGSGEDPHTITIDKSEKDDTIRV